MRIVSNHITHLWWWFRFIVTGESESTEREVVRYEGYGERKWLVTVISGTCNVSQVGSESKSERSRVERFSATKYLRII